MKKIVPTALSLPTLVTTLCALFVEIEIHLEQSAELQLTGLFARALIVVSFSVFLFHARRYEIFSVLKTLGSGHSEGAAHPAAQTVA